MELATVVGLILIGLILIYIEIFLLPGSFFMGALGGLALIAGIILAYSYFGSPAGHYALGVVLLSFVGTLVFGYKKITSGSWVLRKSIQGKMNVIDTSAIKVGDVGKTFSDLKPGGKAILNGKRMEVFSLGEYVDRDVSVEVAKIEQNKIYVKLQKK